MKTKTKTCIHCRESFTPDKDQTYLKNENRQPPSRMKAVALSYCPYCGALNKVGTWGY